MRGRVRVGEGERRRREGGRGGDPDLVLSLDESLSLSSEGILEMSSSWGSKRVSFGSLQREIVVPTYRYPEGKEKKRNEVRRSSKLNKI